MPDGVSSYLTSFLFPSLRTYALKTIRIVEDFTSSDSERKRKFHSVIPSINRIAILPSAQPSASFNPFGFGFGMPDVCALWSKQGSVRCMSETNEHRFLSVGVTFYNLMNQINSRGFQNVKIYYSKANTKKAIIILPLFSKKNTKKNISMRQDLLIIALHTSRLAVEMQLQYWLGITLKNTDLGFRLDSQVVVNC
jgi:hypothetical protein